ncbi:hypothetical protein DIPPA_05555 [Diplonema papillatum]|nr:hypothetical protein DIPPA_07410 [Diplonema papillatum]KAJ9439070.1 hypothetical protein DIPPA_33071 [Diplonema papillatum]KAJ9439901.1 hypothetical protein DIPPA_04532 [Diplonema papillatum]KAJ9441261.1 hypothetical protein DIPPA_32295 [Diplonema papillatum]KAJ9441330.1 hypothetical protein DIPPA_21256 [Diplonema papillatum]
MEDALSKFRELPYGSFQFTHSKELVLMLKDAPDEVKRAVKTGKVRGHSVTRVIDSLSVGGRPITEPEFRDLTARVTGTETEDWEKKPLQRLILLLTVIHDRVELDVFRQLLEEPERMPRTPGVAPQEAAVDEPEALVADTPKQHPRVRIDLTSLAPEGGQQTPRGGQDGPKDLKPPHLGFDESEGDEEEVNPPAEQSRTRVEDVLYDPSKWDSLSEIQAMQLMDELKKLVPAERGDARDAASSVIGVVQLMLNHGTWEEIASRLLDLLLFLQFRTRHGLDAALAYQSKMARERGIPKARKAAMEAADATTKRKRSVSDTEGAKRPRWQFRPNPVRGFRPRATRGFRK